LIRLIAFGGVLTISWSGIFIVLADVAPVTAAFFRAAYAMPVLALLWYAGRNKDNRPARARLIAIGAGLLLAADLTAWHHTIDLIGAGLATVLASIQVVLVPLAAWVFLNEHPSPLALRVAPIVFGGVVLVSGLGTSDSFGADPGQGILFGLLTAVLCTGFIFLLRLANRGYLVPTPGPLLDATAGAAVGALVIGLFDSSFSLAPSWPAHGWLVAVALVAQVAGWIAISHALPRLPAVDTSVMLLLQPVAAVLWARLVIDEQPSLVQWTGVLVVLLGIGLFARIGSQEARVTSGAVGSRRST
jgi:drug/metabolite transporter (DMT)-like permease